MFIYTDMLKASFSLSEQNSQKMTAEIQELKKKLREQKQQTETAESMARKMADVVSRSKGALASVLSDLRSVNEEREKLKDAKPIKSEPINGE